MSYFYYPKNEVLASVDRFEETTRSDLQLYKDLAECLYNNPTQFGTHNKCTNKTTSEEEIIYTVQLYPNGGTGIEEGREFTYSGITKFEKFPAVTKENCKLDGWNVGSVDGTPYYTDIRPVDNGKKLYARWICNEDEYIVTFKRNDETNEIYDTKTVKANEKVPAPENNPQREGFLFNGWITIDDKIFDFPR